MVVGLIKMITTKISMVIVAIGVIIISMGYAHAINYEPIAFLPQDGISSTVAFDDEGRLYVGVAPMSGSTAQPKINVYQNNNGSWTLIGTITHDPANNIDLHSNAAIEWHNGYLYVLHHHNWPGVSIYQIQFNDAGIESVNRIAFLNGIGKMNHINGLDIDANGNIVLGDNGEKRVQIWERDGDTFRLIMKIDGQKIYDEANMTLINITNPTSVPFGSITGLSVDENGRYLIADKGNERIHIFTIGYEVHHLRNGGIHIAIDNAERIVSFGGAGASLGHFSDIRDVETVKHSVDDTERRFIIVSDTANGRLQLFDADIDESDLDEDGIAEPVFHYGSSGNDARNLNFARKVAQYDDIVAVGDSSNGRVVLLKLNEELGNHIDFTIPSSIEERTWYSFTNHREMFDIIVRHAYWMSNGQIDSISANELSAKSLNHVVRQIRTLPLEDRINIPWSSHMKLNRPLVDGNVIYGIGCAIGVDGASTINSPSDIGHQPPPRAELMHQYNTVIGMGMETLMCSVAIMPKAGENINLSNIVENAVIKFVDPNGTERYPYITPKSQYPLDNHDGIIFLQPGNQFMSSNGKFAYIAFGMPLNEEGRWTLSVEIQKDDGSKINLDMPFLVADREGIMSVNIETNAELRNILADHGLSNTQIDDIINELNWNETGVVMLEARSGSLYMFGCVLPHTPPLNIGETVQCFVIFTGTSTVNGLHVYANKPDHTHHHINFINWAPNTIPSLFTWVTPPITLTEAGQWEFVADFTQDGKNNVVIRLDVTFNVVPEMIIGTIGLVATTLGILAAYRLRRN